MQELNPVSFAKPTIIRELPPISITRVWDNPIIEETQLNCEVFIEIDEWFAQLIAKTLYGEYRGKDKLQQAAVIWCILNRCDAWNMSIEEVVTTPNQFHGYNKNNPVETYLYEMVIDVMTRWEREKLGYADVGRILPKDYLWFSGDGEINHFRNAYKGGDRWDWSLESPYDDSSK